MKFLKLVFGNRIGEAAYADWKSEGWTGKINTGFIVALWFNLMLSVLFKVIT